MRKDKSTMREGIRCLQKNFGSHQLVVENGAYYLTGREFFLKGSRLLSMYWIWNDRFLKVNKFSTFFCQICSFGKTPKLVAKWERNNEIIYQSANWDFSKSILGRSYGISVAFFLAKSPKIVCFKAQKPYKELLKKSDFFYL